MQKLLTILLCSIGITTGVVGAPVDAPERQEVYESALESLAGNKKYDALRQAFVAAFTYDAQCRQTGKKVTTKQKNSLIAKWRRVIRLAQRIKTAQGRQAVSGVLQFAKKEEYVLTGGFWAHEGKAVIGGSIAALVCGLAAWRVWRAWQAREKLKRTQMKDGKKKFKDEAVLMEQLEGVCVICMDEMNLEQNLVSPATDVCMHVYHRDCLHQWFQQKQECPTCKEWCLSGYVPVAAPRTLDIGF